MKIRLLSILVNDQERAEDFYTWPLGFRIKTDIPVGEYRWLTMVSEEDPDGPELLLEPCSHSAAKAYQEALYRDKIAAAMLFVDDLQSIYDRLLSKGVVFVTPPTDVGGATVAVFDDTCGNYIQLVEG